MNTYNNHFFASKIQNSKPSVLADFYMPSNGLGAVLMQNAKSMKTRKQKAPPKKKNNKSYDGWENANDNLYPLCTNPDYNDYIVDNILTPLGLGVAVNKTKTSEENYFPMFAFYDRNDKNPSKLFFTTAELKKEVGNNKLLKNKFFGLFDYYNKYAKQQSDFVIQETRKVKNNSRAVKQIAARGKLDPAVDDNGALIPELYIGEGLNFDNTMGTLDPQVAQQNAYATGTNPSVHNINLETAYAAY